MAKIDRRTLALRLAKAILLFKGDITLEDIKALSLLDSNKEAQMIYDYLRNQYMISEKFINPQVNSDRKIKVNEF